LAAAVKNGFGNLFARGKSPEVPDLKATSFQRRHDRIISHEFVNQKVRQKDFFKNFGIPALQNPDISLE
jgi:hypothetical protein